MFRQQQRRAVTFAVEAHDILVMRFVVDEELVALAGRLIESIEGIQVSLSLAAPDGHALARGQSHIVAPLLLHVGQQFLLVRADIQHPFVAHVAGVGIDAEAAPLERGQPLLVTIRHARLDFEHERAAFVCLGAHVVEQHAQRRGVGIVDDGSARRIEIGAAQHRNGRDKDEHSGA